MTTSTWTVFIAALITALATGLGALPFFLVKDIPRHWLGIFNGIAAGLMLGASFSLVNNGAEIDVWRMLFGLLVGVVLISLAHRRLETDEPAATVKAFQGAEGMKSLLIVGIMTLHSFSEGVGVGVSFGGSSALGNFITAAIAIHNIPEGLAISLVMVPRGTSPWKAGLWSIFSSLPQPLMAVPAFLFVTIFRPFLPFGLGLAAGAMLWMVFAELIPDALEEVSHNAVAVSISLSFAAMLGFQALL
jgi:ZIP family zinc transporter